ncbi:DUF6900 domain-containing protein [Endozoicomonas atrinae]|uniref:DUF6900 domain-containing protein n=1 Tax=Endozoicomonas atrinae TaxID=1333660 RepID=UPI000AA12268|nr:hypothetical protein [Endozoicomonas atrinae]
MNKRTEKALTAIAKNNRLFDTLSERKTSEDFNEVAVWCVRKALEEAYQQGFKDGKKQ